MILFEAMDINLFFFGKDQVYKFICGMTEEVDYCKDITEKSFRKELSGVTKNEKYF